VLVGKKIELRSRVGWVLMMGKGSWGDIVEESHFHVTDDSVVPRHSGGTILARFSTGECGSVFILPYFPSSRHPPPALILAIVVMWEFTGCGVSDCGGPVRRGTKPPPWWCCRIPAVDAGR